MTVLHSEPLKTTFSNQNSQYLKEKRVSTVKRFQEGEYLLHGYEIFFSRFLLLSKYQNTFKTSTPCFRKKSDKIKRQVEAKEIKTGRELHKGKHTTSLR